MRALGSKLRSLEGGLVAFWCPGCKQAHTVAVSSPTYANWGYNSNPDAPTFSPSIRVRGTHPVADGRGAERKPFLCHSFVTDGHIQFLGNCSHDLAGQTAALPDFPDGEVW